MEIPGADIDYYDLKSKASLLDYDIIIINPDIRQFYYDHSDYKGKPCLNDSNSFKLKEHLQHWRREIKEATLADKTVFIIMSELDEVFVATGQKDYSGTGRNRSTTRIVEEINNYYLLPLSGLKVTSSVGKEINPCNQNIIANYWKLFKDISSFKVTLKCEDIEPILVTKSGNKCVGATKKSKSSKGALILLPYISFNEEKYYFTNREDGKDYWNKEGIKDGKKFISSLVEISKTLRNEKQLTPLPEWVNSDEFILPQEQIAQNKIMEIDGKIEKLQKSRERHLQTIKEETILKNLLFENGIPLEEAIHKSLSILGFKTSRYKDQQSEFDVVFESKEGRLIGEAEGKNAKPISITKMRQLEINILEDYERDEVTEIANGVLVGNAFRNYEPHERGDFFTEKCLKAADRNGIALIRSIDLFHITKHFLETNDKAFSSKCRELIVESKGVVTFPPIPENQDKEITTTKKKIVSKK